jgi:uncharacterized membrane protein YphA (DoxX/SURF4 family)
MKRKRSDWNKYKEYAPIVLRLGLSLVFLWFGLTQLINPESFFGYIPDWITPHSVEMIHEHPFQSAHNLPLTPHIIIMANGAFETLFGLLLLVGLFTRISSLLLAAHLFFIMIGLGYNDIAVRDFGLVVATIAIFLLGPDKWCFDKKIRNIETFK